MHRINHLFTGSEYKLGLGDALVIFFIAYLADILYRKLKEVRRANPKLHKLSAILLILIAVPLGLVLSVFVLALNTHR